MATDDAPESSGDAAAGEGAGGESAGGESANEAPSEGWRRVRDALVGAGQWALDVFRGHARSRHLNNREK